MTANNLLRLFSCLLLLFNFGQGFTIVQPLNSTIDAFGVERSSDPFVVQPTLYLNIMYDLYDKDPSADPVKTAEALLAVDMQTNEKLNITWDLAVKAQPTYDSVQLAAYAYSMQEPEFLFQYFNDATSAFRDDSDYAAYDYKGFFALLQIGSQLISMDQLYRGVSYKQDAEVGQYIRFNRFLSTSQSYEVAQKFAGKAGSIFVIRGSVAANHIAPFSLKPEEEEYLLTQDSQFHVTDIQPDYILPNGNLTKLITMVPVSYDNLTSLAA